MFSTEKFVLKGALAALALFGAGTAALAQTVVVRAGGPSARSYPVGKSLTSTAKITLVAGDSLTVLDAKGTRTLRGPGSFNASGGAVAPDKRNSFSALVSTQNRKQSRTGAVRGDNKMRSPNLWYVDVRKPATMCVADPAKVELWRPDMQKADTLMVKNDASGQAVNANWMIGKNTLGWPKGMPVTDGASYTLTWSGATAPVKVKMVSFGTAAASDPAKLGEALHARGCNAQFDLLAASLEDTTLASGQGF